MGDQDVRPDFQDDVFERLYCFGRSGQAKRLGEGEDAEVGDAEEGTHFSNFGRLLCAVIFGSLTQDFRVSLGFRFHQFVHVAFVVFLGSVREDGDRYSVAHRDMDPAGAGAVGEVVGVGKDNEESEAAAGPAGLT